jgi:cyclopropane fatty-acyl-phospholipid synthase-like methyltransferase
MKKYQDSIKQRLTARHKYTFQFVDNADIKNKNILDIGASYGWFVNWSIKMNCKGITALEPTKKGFKGIDQYLTSAVFKVGSGLNIPEPNNSFDTVVSFEVIEHLPKNKEIVFFKEINRVLKDQGAFYLSTPNKHILSNIGDPAWWLIGHRHYSLNKLKNIATKTGFEIEKVEYRGKIWEQISLINLYFSKWILGREMIFKNWLEKKRDQEFFNKNGYVNIFMKLNKIKSLL